MNRLLCGLLPALLLPGLLWADDKAKTSDKAKAGADDSPLVKKTREVKLTTKVTVDFKDEPLRGCMAEFKRQADVSYHLEAGVSGNQAFTYSATDKPLRDVLDEMFKGRGLGYIIGRKQKEGDRYEGWLIITQGDERGDPIVKGAEPKKPDPKTTTKTETKPEPKKPASDPPASEADQKEAQAARKLKQAKAFLEDKMVDDARDYLDEVVKKYAGTKSAEEAKKLLEKLKK